MLTVTENCHQPLPLVWPGPENEIVSVTGCLSKIYSRNWCMAYENDLCTQSLNDCTFVRSIVSRLCELFTSAIALFPGRKERELISVQAPSSGMDL